MIGYKTGNALSADLKATCHRVRQAIDALPAKMPNPDGTFYNPRSRRLVPIITEDGKQVMVRPEIPGKQRHYMAFPKKGRFL